MTNTMHATIRDSRRRRGLVLGVALLAAVPLAGCADDGPARKAVSGTVALDGRPLDAGSITFAPVDGFTAANAEVVDGAFRIDRASGLAPGRYQVQIVADRSTGKTIPNPDFPDRTIEEVNNVIPPRYNVKTELTVEVKPDADEPYAFNLSSQAAAAPSRSRRR
jgi:hypothetical protein